MAEEEEKKTCNRRGGSQVKQGKTQCVPHGPAQKAKPNKMRQKKLAKSDTVYVTRWMGLRVTDNTRVLEKEGEESSAMVGADVER